MNISYTVKRSKRRKKSVALKITDKGKLIVLAPYKMPKGTIEKFVRSKQKWIKKHLDEIKLRQRKFSERKFVDGERFLYLGEKYPLLISQEEKNKLYFNGKNFLLNKKHASKARELFVKWYKDKAYEYILGQVEHFSKLLGIKYKNIKIINARTRWGSCSYDNSLHFNYKIIMAPPVIIKYVIIHEMMHILEKNHSKKFWASVEKIMPMYKKYKKWLNDNGSFLYV